MIPGLPVFTSRETTLAARASSSGARGIAAESARRFARTPASQFGIAAEMEGSGSSAGGGTLPRATPSLPDRTEAEEAASLFQVAVRLELAEPMTLPAESRKTQRR
jgi:hypothetical protein